MRKGLNISSVFINIKLDSYIELSGRMFEFSPPDLS
jgi:hypothetical protein